MRYLKIYEDFSKKSELQEFCDTHLVDLSDIDFRIEVIERDEYAVIALDIPLNTDGIDSQYKTFRYNNTLKDKLLPFLDILSDEYNVESLHFNIIQYPVNLEIQQELDDVLTDNIDKSILNGNIEVIEITLTKYAIEENVDSTLHIFDFDDTLVDAPSFDNAIISYLKEEFNFKGELYKSLKMIGSDIKDLKWQDDRVYVEDPNNKLNVNGNWSRKGQRVYLTTPYAYMFSDLSLPSKLLSTSKIYKQCENKAIVTARPISIKDKIESSMQKLGLELPNYGLFMYDKDGHNRVGEWKGNKIVELLKDSGFKKAIFYDDNSKYLKAVNRIVNEQMPDINFKIIKV